MRLDFTEKWQSVGFWSFVFILCMSLSFSTGLRAEVADTDASAIKIGVVASLTGSNAALGERLKQGALEAIEEINDHGGILGHKIDALIGDDSADPKQGIIIANQFITAGVKFVIGHNTSGVAIPASEIYAEADVLLISPTATNPKYTERGLWNTIRVIGRDDQQAQVAAQYIAQNFRGKTIALVHDKTPYGKGLVDEVRKALLEEGIKPLFYEGINPGEKDYSALVSRLKVANIDLVFSGTILTETGLILRQMHDYGIHAVLMGGDVLASAELGAIAGPAILGTLMTFPPDPQANPWAKEVIDTFKLKNIDSESTTLYAYGAVQLLKEAIEKANSLDPKVVAETIRSGTQFKSVLGLISFDGKGDIKGNNFVVYRWIQTPAGCYTYTEW